MELHNPVDMPDPAQIDHIEEPWIKATIMVPDEYLGAILALCTERRGMQVDLTYVGNRAMVVYRIPLNEVVFDFYDRLKSVSRGYASFDYQMDGYAEGELVRISILVNNDPVDALSFIAHRAVAETRGRAICGRLKDLIPRQLFKIAIQAAIGGRVIARETIGALSQGRDGEMLRRRHHAQAETAGEAEGRQKADAAVRQGGNPAVGVPGRAEDGRVTEAVSDSYGPHRKLLPRRQMDRIHRNLSTRRRVRQHRTNQEILQRRVSRPLCPRQPARVRRPRYSQRPLSRLNPPRENYRRVRRTGPARASRPPCRTRHPAGRRRPPSPCRSRISGGTPGAHRDRVGRAPAGRLLPRLDHARPPRHHRELAGERRGAAAIRASRASAAEPMRSTCSSGNSSMKRLGMLLCQLA